MDAQDSTYARGILECGSSSRTIFKGYASEMGGKEMTGRWAVESAIGQRSAMVSFQPRIYPQPLTVNDTTNPEGIFLFRQYLCPLIPPLLAPRPARQPLAHLSATATNVFARFRM